MAGRIKDSSDFDLEHFADLFDTAMSSDNPTVKKSLRNLLMVVALVDGEIDPKDRINGPLRRLIDNMRHLNNRIGQLEYQLTRSSVPDIYTRPTISNGTYTVSSSIDALSQTRTHELTEQIYQEILNRIEKT